MGKDAKLKTRIRHFFKEEMAAKGYVLKRARMPERVLDGLRQGIEFQPGSQALSGRYTLNIYWSFPHPLDDGNGMDGCARLGELMGTGDRWFSLEDGELDADWEIVRGLLLDVVLPHLDRYGSIAQIVEDVSNEQLDVHRAFGVDWGWIHFNLGYCYAYLGDVAEAIYHYTQVVEAHSHWPQAWVKTRREHAVAELTRLGG